MAGEKCAGKGGGVGGEEVADGNELAVDLKGELNVR